jgi:beta-lactam-binding protein with PASTA domain
MTTHRYVLAVAAALLAVLLPGCADPDGAGAKPPEVNVTIGTDPTNATKTAAVPDVVGENHQVAQDTMQAAGFFKLLEEDATGQHRMLINDRNWVVVSQQPKAGSRVPLDTTVTLRSKKATDP